MTAYNKQQLSYRLIANLRNPIKYSLVEQNQPLPIYEQQFVDRQGQNFLKKMLEKRQDILDSRERNIQRIKVDRKLYAEWNNMKDKQMNMFRFNSSKNSEVRSCPEYFNFNSIIYQKQQEKKVIYNEKCSID